MENKRVGAQTRMRILDKRPRLQRRSLLRGAGAGAVSITFVPAIAQAAVGVQKAEEITRQLPHLTDGTARTLVRMARDIYPHDRVADKYYIQALLPYDQVVGHDEALRELLFDGVEDLNGRAQRRHDAAYADLRRENERVTLLREIEATPFFARVQGDLVTAFYNNKAIWPLFGFEGSSWERGGYVDRGFDDLDWL